MNSLLNPLLTQSAAPLAHTFIVGAGDGSQLPQWRELQSEHLHLAEAHPQQAKALQQHARDHEDVFAGAITPNAQANVALNILTLPQYSSLNTPTALQRLLPNVRHHRTEDVAAQRLEDWLAQAKLDPSAIHTLVLDAPGQTHALLTATAPSTLQAFSWIIATTAEHALYDNDADGETLNDTLNQLGYTCISEDEGAAYPTIKRLYQRQPAAVERLKLTQELNQTRQLAAKHEQALEDARVMAKSEATKQSQALEVAKKQANEHKQALDATTKQLAERDQKLKEETQQLSAKTQAFEDVEAARIAAENQATQQSQALENAKKQANEHKQALDKTTQRLAERDKQLAEREQHLKEQTQQLAERDKQLSEKANALAAADKKAHEHKQALDAKAQQLAERDEQLTERDKQLSGKEKERQQIIHARDALQQEKDKLNEQVQALKEEVATKESRLASTDERFGALEGKLDQLFGEQRSYIQQTTNALGQHVTRSAKQQRDEQALTHYMQHGQRPISTQLPSDFAMALLEQRDTQRYDVMLVLGSTAVTELLAQAVINETNQPQRLANTKAAESGKETQRYVAPSQDDLPQAIISLAHQKAECQALKQRLAASQCHQAVNVVHAPWIEASYQNQTSLFYASEVTLQRLNGWLREDAKVLIVVGDALAQAGHSRTTALPQLLQHLPTQTLDVVLEGADYSQEEHLANEWETLLQTRQREMQWLKLPCAIGLKIAG